MKISKSTLNLLLSLTKINPSISIKKGNILSTINIGVVDGRTVPIKTVLIRAEVPEEFPINFSIYNLKQFLEIVDTFEGEPDFDFKDSYVTISEKNNSIRYGYCKPTLVLISELDNLELGEDKENFMLDSKTIMRLKKLSGVLKHDDLFIKNSSDGKGIEFILTTVTEGSTGEDSTNDSVLTIEKETSAEFNVKISMKNLTYVITTDKAVYNARIGNYKGKDMLVLENLGETKITYFVGRKK